MATISSRSNGFTLIEIMIAVLLIGILATIAVPKYQRHKRQAYVASVKADLRHLELTQEIHFAGAMEYSAMIGPLDFQESDEITVRILEASLGGWSADAVYQNTSVRCALFYGNATPVPPATVEGVPACTY